MSAPTPNYRNGKVCYIEIPAADAAKSARFYQRVFGWSIRQSNDGSTAFDDTTGNVSGMWIAGRPASPEVAGLIVSVMVARAAKTCEAIVAEGGQIVQPVDPESKEVYALFRDPAGNILSIYQEARLNGETGG